MFSSHAAFTGENRSSSIYSLPQGLLIQDISVARAILKLPSKTAGLPYCLPFRPTSFFMRKSILVSPLSVNVFRRGTE
jgi:hypothetical protein